MKRILLALVIFAGLAAAPAPVAAQTTVIAVTYRGTYSPSTPYGQGAIVLYNGSSFISTGTALNQGNTPPTPAATSAFWQPILAPGAVTSLTTSSGTNCGVPTLIAGTLNIPPCVPPTTPSAFGPSGSAHATGLVPDPGATAGTTRYLREDGTWAPAGGSVTVVSSTCSGAQTITLSSTPTRYVITLTANCTLSFATSTFSGTLQQATVDIVPAGFAVIFPPTIANGGNVAWPGGVVPALLTTAPSTITFSYNGTSPIFGGQ
jgi:hypothetical protein